MIYKTREETEAWLKNYGVTNYTINDDLTVDILGNLRLYKKRLSKLKVQFRYVSGNCWIDCNRLESLEGAPYEIGMGFSCQHNHLESLKYAPKRVGNDSINCSHNFLKTLEINFETLFYKQFCCENNPNLELDESFKNVKKFSIDQAVLDRFHLKYNSNIKELKISKFAIAYKINTISQDAYNKLLISKRLKKIAEYQS